MREIQVAENKTLKLTNVLARKIDASELGNLGVILTQMQNFIKSHSAMPVGPVIQCVKFTSGPNPEPQIYFMMQVNQLIPRLEPGYEQDAVLRVKGCLYAHFTGPMDHSSLASQKLNIYAYEHEIELTGTTYSIYVNQDSENGVKYVFMETKEYDHSHSESFRPAGPPHYDGEEAAGLWLRAHSSGGFPHGVSGDLEHPE